MGKGNMTYRSVKSHGASTSIAIIYRLSKPSIDKAPAPPNITAMAIRRSARVYSMPLPLPGAVARKNPCAQWPNTNANAMNTAKQNATGLTKKPSAIDTTVDSSITKAKMPMGNGM